MSIVWLAIFLMILLEPMGLRRAHAATGSISIAGTEYADFDAWMQSKGAVLQWQRNGEDFKTTHRWMQLAFKVDSRRAEINRIAVWLAHAVAAREGKVLVSRLDIQTTLQPLLFATRPPNSKRPRVRTVALDPGHGGKDPGNQEGGHQEKYHTLLLAKEVRKKLVSAGLNAVLTRSTDYFLELEDRPLLAKKVGADLLISLHYNSTPGSGNGVRGAEVYCLPPVGAGPTNGRGDANDYRVLPGNRNDFQNLWLAYSIQKRLVQGWGSEDRGVRRARWAVLREAAMPAVLIESGFMSDSQEARKIYSDKHRKQLAQAIADGILIYKRMMDR